MQRCAQLLKPLEEEKLREDLIVQGVKPQDIECGNSQPSFWYSSSHAYCYDVNEGAPAFPLMVLHPLDESEKQGKVDECETELAALQGEDELQKQMAKCLVDYAEVLNRKTGEELHEGGADVSDIICRSDVPTQSHKVWLVNYENFEAYSGCALKTDNEPPYPYEREANEPLPDDTQKQTLLEECKTKLAEAEDSWGEDLDDIDQLAESMQECKQEIRGIQNRQHRAELVAQGSNPSDIVCHTYPSAEDEPLWYVDTWSDCYDQTASERTPLSYDYGDHNENRELTNDQKQDFLNSS